MIILLENALRFTNKDFCIEGFFIFKCDIRYDPEL